MDGQGCCLLAVDGAGGSHSVSIGPQHTEVGGPQCVASGNTARLVVVRVVSAAVCYPGVHVVSRALHQHVLNHLQHRDGGCEDSADI